VAALYLINRTTERAVELAREIQQRQVGLEVAVGYPPGEVDLMLNATSLGLKRGDPPPWDETRFAVGRARAVYDMVYRPAETPLLAAARAAGCRVTNGLGMLLYQGAQAVELWSEMPSPLAAMRLALEGTIYGNSSR
jgi:shikimate dehydrogenase